MCLGEVAQVVRLGPGRTALVRSSQRTASVSLLTLDEDVAPGDWVLVHSGFALTRLSVDEAAEASAIRATAGVPAGGAGTTPAPTVPPRKDTS